MEEMQELKDIKFYEIKEVAKMLNVTSRTICNYIKSGKLKAVKIGGKLKRKASKARFIQAVLKI